MPLAGGAADKAGNSYERRWTVFALLYLLNGVAQSMRIEVPGEDGVAAEFRTIVDGIPNWHQAKRQRDAGPWTISNMSNEGVLDTWWDKISRGGRVVFVSSTGAQEIHELVERANASRDWEEFNREFLTGTQNTRFQRLRTAWSHPPEEEVYAALHCIEVRLLGERDLAEFVNARLVALVDGHPELAAAVLAQLVDESCHIEIAPDDVVKRLAANGISIRPARGNTRVTNRQTENYSGRPLKFGGVDVGVQVLVGTLGLAFGRQDIQSTLLDGAWVAPPDLREHARRYAERFGYYDGSVVRLHKLDVETYPDGRGAERHRLRLEMVPTGFFDMIATNIALGPFSTGEAPLLAGRSGVPDTPLSNMIGLDLTLVTEDGWVPVFFRAGGMAALERCWQSSSGETLQLPVDLDTDGRPSLFKTALRGLQEELSIQPERISDLVVTALVATPEYANIGVLMRGTLDCTGDELEREISRYVLGARDNWEYTSHALLAIDDVRDVASALTDPIRPWTKQAVASLVFAHAERANGNVLPLADAINAAGTLNLQVGPATRGVLPDDWLCS